MLGFQEWLSGIPGIDEATALSSAINHIESGEYDVIVFDTAPTGHTIKLLQLPAILQAGLDKLEGWTTTIYSYWETFKGAFSSSSDDGANSNRLTAKTKKEITEKLHKYKANIQRVGKMLTDAARTRFVVVCIAEYLSVNETQRLLVDLGACGVQASHVVVNQLVEEDACLDDKEMAKIEKWASSSGMTEAMKLVATKARNACKLTSSRRALQCRYLAELRDYKLVQEKGLCVVEVPLLTKEVTGASAIQSFSQLLTSKHRPHTSNSSQRARKVQKVLYGRDTKAQTTSNASSGPEEPTSNPLADKVKALLEDPEIKGLIMKNPKAQMAVDEMKSNPMSVMTYMADPELQPLVQAAMKKLF